MYEERFGLKLNPFRGNSGGANVFVGPQQAKTISALQKALKGADNVLTVTGPAGVGKTILVDRALETNKAHQLVSAIGRMRLGPDEVLDLLLAGFGVNPNAAKTLQKMAMFQRILTEKASKNIRVVIVVEDALRIGNDALLELEALTAADTGNAGGASLILMGLPEVRKRLNFPELARLRQRARLGQVIAPLTAAEVQGYLNHCLRVAGASPDAIFETGSASMLYRCSEGIPRVINSICDAALSEAHDAGKTRVCADLIQQVALDVYGLEPIDEESPIEPRIDSVISEKAPTDAKQKLHVAEDVDPQPRDAETESESDAEPSSEPESEAEAEAESKITAPEPELPPLVAAALAQEADEQLELQDEAEDEEVRGDDSIELPDLSALADLDDIPGDHLIADTGMNVSPEFKPDPELDLPASQLAEVPTPEHKQSESGVDPSAIATDDEDPDDVDDLPMLSTSMRVDILKPDPANTASTRLPGTEEPELQVSEFTAEPTVTIKAIDPDSLAELTQEPEHEPEGELTAEVDSEPELEPIVEAVSEPVPEPEPVLEAAPEPVPKPEPVLEAAPEPEPEPEPEPALEAQLPAVPEPIVEEAADEPPVAATSETAVEESYKPIPDLDALQAAISAARGTDPIAPSQEEEVVAVLEDPVAEPVLADLSFAEPEPHAERSPEASSPDKDEAPVVPEITLDQTLEDQRKEGRKLDEMAAELANANSLEDISDIMAETLFGEEFEAIAAAAIANPPATGTLPGEEPDVVASPAAADNAPSDSPANDSMNELSPIMLDVVNDIPEPTPVVADTEVILSSSPEPGPVDQSRANLPSVDSIDSQFQTGITQTLKTLKTHAPETPKQAADSNDSDNSDDEPKSGGLFGRLKRSFKG